MGRKMIKTPVPTFCTIIIQENGDGTFGYTKSYSPGKSVGPYGYLDIYNLTAFQFRFEFNDGVGLLWEHRRSTNVGAGERSKPYVLTLRVLDQVTVRKYLGGVGPVGYPFKIFQGNGNTPIGGISKRDIADIEIDGGSGKQMGRKPARKAKVQRRSKKTAVKAKK
jgi:hypothetical protein